MSDVHDVQQRNIIRCLQDELMAAQMRSDWALTEIGDYVKKLKAHEHAWSDLYKEHPDQELYRLMSVGKIPEKYMKGK